MFKFIHAADIHLDSPLLNLDQYDGAPVEMFRDATRRAFDNVVELAIREHVRFVLIAGDLYDGDCRDFNTPLHLRHKMRQLLEHGINVYICQGNHDAQNGMTRAFRLNRPPNVHLFSTNEPETFRLDEMRVAIHGQGYGERVIEQDLSTSYPPPIPGWMNIGVLHTSCGHHESHARYAPSSVRGLTAKGYDYWALGHVHTRQDLAGGPHSVHIRYPGNTQGRHIREAGAKGCLLITVTDVHEPLSVRFHATDVVRWSLCPIDARQCDSPDELLERIRSGCENLLAKSDGRPLAVRIEVNGDSPIHHALAVQRTYWESEIRTHVLSHFDDQLWIEKIRFATRPPVQGDSIPESGGPLNDLLTGILAIESLQDVAAELQDEFAKLSKLIPVDPRLPSEDTFDCQQLASPQTLAEMKSLLIGKLLNRGETL